MSADFTPEKEDLKVLTPFKMQVLTNFPYIEADFDALTNYQLLCKIVEYLNEVIAETNEVTEQTESLYNAYVALQNYVNTYFDNLDIGNEVDRKIDEMVEDGTMTRIIKQYIDPLYQDYEQSINLEISTFETSTRGEISNQNTRITTFENNVNNTINTLDNKVNSLASGSPAGVYATVSALTTDDPDHSKIYLVTADGKWYYYNTTETDWVAGGTYQAEESPELENIRVAYNNIEYDTAGNSVRSQILETQNLIYDFASEEVTETKNVVNISNSSENKIKLKNSSGNDIMHIHGNFYDYHKNTTAGIISGITITDNHDGTFRVSGTATAEVRFNLNLTSDRIQLNPGKYFCSGCPTLESPNRIRFIFSASGIGQILDDGEGALLNVDNTTGVYITVVIYDGSTVDEVLYPMINLGEEAIEWEAWNGEELEVEANTYITLYPDNTINNYYTPNETLTYQHFISNNRNYIEEKNAKAISYNYKNNINSRDIWEQGNIDTTDGTNGNPAGIYQASRIRTADYITPNYIVCNNDYRANIYKYNKDTDAFIEAIISQQFYKFDSRYKYRLVLMNTTRYQSNVTISPSDYDNIEIYKYDLHIDSDLNKLPYVDLTPFTNYKIYRGIGSDYSLLNYDTTYSELISLYDDLLGATLTKEDLGLCSDGVQHLYAYHYKPILAYYDQLAQYWKSKKIPKIIIISGQHGEEKGSPLGLYYLIRDLVTSNYSNDIVETLARNCEILFIPVTNPWGFNNKKSWNYNGVNLNRNFDTPGFDYEPTAHPYEIPYGGLEPFDQPESAIIRDLVLDNLDAFMFLDWHANTGNQGIMPIGEYNWLSFADINDPYYIDLAYCGDIQLRNITQLLKIYYGIDYGECAGNISRRGELIPAAGVWCNLTAKIMGFTFETSGAFPGLPMSNDSIRCVSEVMGNYLNTVLTYFNNKKETY